jgi:hypothetical protein
MSDEEYKVENVEKQINVKLKNTINDEELELNATKENVDKLRNLIEQQNEQNRKIVDENQRLKEEKANNPASFGALLNQNQITGQTTIPLDVNDGLPTDMQIFNDECELINSLEKQSKSGNNEATKALNDLLLKSTKTSWSAEYLGNDTKALFKTPKTDAEKKDFAQKRRMWSVSK